MSHLRCSMTRIIREFTTGASNAPITRVRGGVFGVWPFPIPTRYKLSAKSRFYIPVTLKFWPGRASPPSAFRAHGWRLPKLTIFLVGQFGSTLITTQCTTYATFKLARDARWMLRESFLCVNLEFMHSLQAFWYLLNHFCQPIARVTANRLLQLNTKRKVRCISQFQIFFGVRNFEVRHFGVPTLRGTDASW